MPNTDQYNDRQIQLARAWGLKIAEARKATKLSQKSAAESMGVHVSTLRAWEQGRRLPGLYQRRQLCLRYNLDQQEFLCEKEYCPHCGSHWKW